jgi:hypothetical protein
MSEDAGIRAEAVLARLVQQFSSPYDFLRELVQNAMDGGSDLVEVRLITHPGDDDGEVVFELVVIDAGEGMDEAIIDGELTRLFASSKRDDRTMAGGFGIGFVSVFAWEPSTVLLQTGRRDEAWELVFDTQRRFEKYPLDQPFEGTTVRLFRSGRVQEREAIADAVRDSLWRWCRYVPIEVTFEDEAGGTGIELIEDSPTVADAVVAREKREGDTEIRVAFAVPPHAVLLRHGLVLAEGTPEAHLPGLAKLGSTLQHLRVWADSPRLRTSMARDRVVDDEGRAAIDLDVEALVEQMRDELIQRIETVVAEPVWDARTHALLACLHAHLSLELESRANVATERPLLRSPAGTAVSAAGLQRRARARVVAIVPPESADPRGATLRVAAGHSGIPMLVARWPEDQTWLEPILGTVGLIGLPLERVVVAVRPAAGIAESLAALVGTLLRAEDDDLGQVVFGRFEAPAEPMPLVGVEGGDNVAVIGGPLRADWTRGRRIWFNLDHPIAQRAVVTHPRRPLFSAYLLAAAFAARVDNAKLGAEKLTEAVADAAR